MKLTGKCKEDFQMWYFNKFCNSGMKYHELLPHHMNDVFGWFYGLDGSFKWGVFLKFFDSVGINIEIGIGFNKTKEVLSYYYYFEGVRNENPYKSRAKAQKAATNNANDIYNNKSST